MVNYSTQRVSDLTGARWRSIADDLRGQIVSGQYAAGDRLPPELELAALYGVARGTIRRALDALAADGLVLRRTGGFGGTRVRPSPVRIQWRRDVEHGGPWQRSVSEAGMAPSIRPLGVEVVHADEQTASQLELPIGARVVVRRRLMLADTQPLQLARSAFPADLIADSPLDQPGVAANGVLQNLRSLGLAPQTSEESVSSRLPDPSEQRLLGLPSSTPVLVVDRIIRDSALRPLEWLHAVLDAASVHISYSRTDIGTD